MEVRPLEPIELARIIVDLASDKKGEKRRLMDMRQVSPITDFFIIVTAQRPAAKSHHRAHRGRTQENAQHPSLAH